jgi:hypothetical protein
MATLGQPAQHVFFEPRHSARADLHVVWKLARSLHLINLRSLQADKVFDLAPSQKPRWPCCVHRLGFRVRLNSAAIRWGWSLETSIGSHLAHLSEWE